jgi:hypothetical protein
LVVNKHKAIISENQWKQRCYLQSNTLDYLQGIFSL